MSSCGGKCGCSSGCQCGDGCKGTGMYPDLSFSESTTTPTIIGGAAPVKMFHEKSTEMSFGAENGCKCGSSCSCDPCTCK